jgi:hypothetical protein
MRKCVKGERAEDQDAEELLWEQEEQEAPSGRGRESAFRQTYRREDESEPVAAAGVVFH